MAHVIWAMTGVLIAALLGAAPPHRSLYGNIVAPMLAGIFGAFLGGIIGSGVIHADHAVTLPGALGAIAGAAIFVLAAQAQPYARNGRIGRGNPGTDDL